MSNKKKGNYEILDELLKKNGIPGGRPGQVWVVPDPNRPDDGYWADTAESVEQIQRANDAIERYLRS